MALVLSRLVGETIVTDGPVTIEVARVEGKHVVLWLTAGKDVTILRGELLEQDRFSEEDEIRKQAGYEA